MNDGDGNKKFESKYYCKRHEQCCNQSLGKHETKKGEIERQ